mgnify:CR=1 FL=1
MELVSPELKDGDWVEVVVNSGQVPVAAHTNLLDFIDALPPGPRAVRDWPEYETQLQLDRESWGQ